MSRAARWTTYATLILLIAAGLRLHAAAFDRRFHPDEALFATFARHAADGGDWLLTGDLDKTPLAIYAQALSFSQLTSLNAGGVLDTPIRLGEIAARLPAAFAGVLVVALLMALARTLYRNELVALWVGLFAALSPLLIAFSGTAFTDMLMLALALLGVWMCARGRWGWAGVWLALAFAAKQQALFFVPVGLALGLIMNGLRWGRLLRFAAALIIGLALVLAWDAARGGPVSLFVLAVQHNQPIETSVPLVARLAITLAYVPALLGAPTVLFLVLIAFAYVLNLRSGPYNRALAIDTVLLVLIAALILAHALPGFAFYDRYWLIAAPAVILLAARAAVWVFFLISRVMMRAEMPILAAVIVLAMAVSAVEAAQLRPGYDLPRSSFPDTSGMDEVAAFLRAQPVATVIYDHWLNWQLGYYLGEWSDKRRAYYPTPEALVTDAVALQECETRFLPAPANVNSLEWVDALQAAGFTVDVALRPRQWIVYAITPGAAVARCAESASPG